MFSTWMTDVGALELLGQVHEEADGGHGVLQLRCFVPNLNGKTQVADTHLVDAQLAMIALALLVGHRRVLRMNCTSRGDRGLGCF